MNLKIKVQLAVQPLHFEGLRTDLGGQAIKIWAAFAILRLLYELMNIVFCSDGILNLPTSKFYFSLTLESRTSPFSEQVFSLDNKTSQFFFTLCILKLS